MKAQKKYYYIYKITNTVNGKIYIGQHSTDNLDDNYLGGGRDLMRDQKKFGKHIFKKEILEFCNDGYELDIRKQQIVNEEFVKRDDTYNRKTGGNQKSWYSDGSRQKMRMAKRNYIPWNKGKHGIYSEETRLRMSEKKKGKPSWSKGIPKTEETKRKISEALKGKMAGEKHPFYGRKGKDNPNWGKHLSDEHKRKISIANKGKIVSEETRQKLKLAMTGENSPFYGKHHSEETKKKISESNKGKKLSEETKEKISKSRIGMPSPRRDIRKVLQIDANTEQIIKEWENSTEAGKCLGIRSDMILHACMRGCGFSKGFKWRFLE